MDICGFLIPAKDDAALKEISVGLTDGSDRQEQIHSEMGKLLGGIDFGQDGRQVLLVRPWGGQPGLMAYYQDGGRRQSNNTNNRRATCFAMTCGLLNARFVGDVVVLTVRPMSQTATEAAEVLLTIDQLSAACHTPDLRSEALLQLAGTKETVPESIANAVSNNYHDRAVLKRFSDVMRDRAMSDDESGDFVSFLDSEGDAFDLDDDDDDDDDVAECASRSSDAGGIEFAVTRVPLCLHCRRPVSSLCNKCQAAYFCDPPRNCRQEG